MIKCEIDILFQIDRGLMTERRRYKTTQRQLVAACLADNVGRYLTVDEALSRIEESGSRIGRTTVYRALEDMVVQGAAFKAVIPGGEARYRISGGDAAGQLVCMTCGNVSSLDCREALGLASHVLDHHGFLVDPARTILYGTCGKCQEAARG